MKPLLAALNRLLHRDRPAQPAEVLDPALDPAAEPDAETDERPLGCGWFDSSHELQSGLVVREHAGVDALGSELPLASWLDWQLAGWRVPQAVMQAA